MTDRLDPVVVIGGGTMGAGIAQRFLQYGHDVVCVEADAGRGQVARDTIANGLERWAARKDDPDAALRALAHLQIRVDLPDAPVRVVIESVPENVELKSRVLANAANHYPDTIIGTNTSALSIDALAAAVGHEHRFVGLHFFNPVPQSALLEIVLGTATDAATTAAARSIATDVGLTAVVVRDSPGFATSRLGIAIGLEAIRMVEEGVSSPADIDTAMMLGYRFPIGPLELSDRVGLDVRLAIADHLHAELGERFRAPDLLRSLVAEGHLGVKSGTGFYTWQEGRRGDDRIGHTYQSHAS